MPYSFYGAGVLHLAAPPIQISLDRAADAYREVGAGTRRKFVLTTG